MKASDVMSAPVIAVPADAPLREVARTLTRRRISGAPVLEGERLVGIVSEADLLRRAPDEARRARDVMTREVAMVAPDAPLEDVAALLAARGIKRVPVVDRGRVVGIVSRSNLVQALAVAPPGEAEQAAEDDVRAMLLERLAAAPWWRRGESNVVLEGGVAHLWGVVHSEEERRAAAALAAAVPGVRAVRDHRALAPARRPEPLVRRAGERGHSRHGWSEVYHSFSFGDFYDPAYSGFGPLQALNEKIVQPGRGATTYGVRDIEILTYMLEGALEHDNSLDERAVLHPGAVQCLSAGAGVRFYEANAGTEPARFLQVWIEPDCAGGPACCARAQFEAPVKRGRLQCVASPDGREGSLRIRQDALVYAGLFDGAQSARLDIGAERLAYVHVARGGVTVQGRELGSGDALAAAGSEPIDLARGRAAEVLVFDLPRTELR